MEKKPGLRWKLGIFIIAGLVLLVFGLYFIGKQKNLFVSVFTIRAAFKNVSGLKVGNNIRFGGIAVGTVENIGLINDTSVMVDMSIKSEVRKFIRRGSRAGIGTEGLMGERVVLISPAIDSSGPIRDNDVLASDQPVETDQIMASLKNSADNAVQITRELSEISYKVNHGHGVIARLLGDSSMGNNLKSTMVNLKKGSQGLDENMEAAKHNFLLRGYFKKKKKAEEKKKKEMEEKKKEEEQEKADKSQPEKESAKDSKN